MEDVLILANAEVSKGRLGRCLPVEKRSNKPSPSPLPSRSILSPLQALSSISLRATGKPTFSSSPAKIRGQHTSQGKKANSWAPAQSKLLFKLKAFLPCRVDRFIYSITVFYQHAGCPRRKGVISKHVEQNPRLSTFDKLAFAHVGLQVENSLAKKATRAAGGGRPHATKFVRWICQSCCQRQPQLLSDRHETPQHPHTEPD